MLSANPCDFFVFGMRGFVSISAEQCCSISILHSTSDGISATLHYTDTGYGHVVQHHQRTSSQQVVDVVQHVHSRLNLLCNHPTSVGGIVVQHVRSHYPCSGVWTIYRMTIRCCTTNLASYGHVVQHLQLVMSLCVGGVHSRCPCSGVWALVYCAFQFSLQLVCESQVAE